MEGCGETRTRRMSYHSPELMEHIPCVPPLALRALSMEDTAAAAAAAAHCASDALRLALPLHLEPRSPSSPSCYLESVRGHMLPPYTRFACFPFHGAFGVCDYSFEPAFIRKRNERERHRVRCVNEGYARLREHLPHTLDDKRLSKVETLRAAIEYIKHLQNLLDLSRVDVTQTFGDARSRSHVAQRTEWDSDGESKR